MQPHSGSTELVSSTSHQELPGDDKRRKKGRFKMFGSSRKTWTEYWYRLTLWHCSYSWITIMTLIMLILTISWAIYSHNILCFALVFAQPHIERPRGRVDQLRWTQMRVFISTTLKSPQSTQSAWHSPQRVPVLVGEHIDFSNWDAFIAMCCLPPAIPMGSQMYRTYVRHTILIPAQVN